MDIKKLELKNINKKISDSFYLEDISLDIYPGEVHAIIGENGSGKSTIMKIISGVIEPDSGELLIDGQPVTIDSVWSSRQNKIHSVWQEVNLFPNLTVAENIFIDHYNNRKMSKKVNLYKMYSDCNNIFKELAINIDVRTPVSKLGYAQKQLVEMVKAFVSNAEIVIFDEPTAAFTHAEKSKLFEIISRLKKSNTAIFYITHLIEEISMIADRVTAIHQGKLVGTRDVKNTSTDEIIKMLSVPNNKHRYPRLSIPVGKTVLSVKNLCLGNILNNISFDLKKSEILGITGLMGSGRSLLANCIFGNVRMSSGNIMIDGKNVTINDPSDAISNGIAFLPEDRLNSSIFGCLDLQYNITVSSLKRFIEYNYLHDGIMMDITNTYINKLSIKPGSPNDILETYSGGNQQKSAIARWIMSRSKIYILDEPTRGIDIASKTDIYNCIIDMVSKGASVILISSDIEEILGMCNRILVISSGRISGEFMASEATKESILYRAAIENV